MDLQVKVIKVLETQKFTSQKNGNEYVKNFFVGETIGQYPKHVAFSVMGDEKFKQMGIVVGGTYNVSFDIDSREWKGRWFTDCNAWKAIRVDGNVPQASQATQPVSQQPQTQVPSQQPSVANATPSSNSNDLPF